MELSELFSVVKTEAGLVSLILLIGDALLVYMLVKLWGQYQSTILHLVNVSEKYDKMVSNTNDAMARNSETIHKLTTLLEVMLDRGARK